MIGELHATFLFDSARVAKLGWERVEKRCRNLSVNRWALDPTDPQTARAVTVITEEPDRDQFERATSLLAGTNGHEIQTPTQVLGILRDKRERLVGDGGRRMVRDPLGRVMLPGGIDAGRLRRPQG